MSTIGIVQARHGSSRLPGKVLEQVGGVPMLNLVLQRLRRSTLIDEVVVATTVSPSDDSIVAAAAAEGITVVRGSVFDVLDRFHDVLVARPDATSVVRVTSDCPFIDPALVDEVIRFRSTRDVDFASNRLPPPYRRTYPIGLDVEVCTSAALVAAWRDADKPFLREHVMPFLYTNPHRFKVAIMDLDEDLSASRWTVDTPADLAAVRAIAELIDVTTAPWREILEVARQHPEIAAINSLETQNQLEIIDQRWSVEDPTA